MLCARLAVAICLLSCFADGAIAENWPQFRGPTGQGLSGTASLPTHWSETDNVAWKASIPGKGWSSPIFQDGKLYLTTAIPAESGPDKPLSLRALCLDAKSGTIDWNVELFQQPGAKSKIHSKNSHASPTPITDGKRLFVHFGTHGTACLDFKGNLVWKNTELQYAPVHGNGGSPVLVAGALVMSCDGGDVQFVVALEQETGKIRWKADRHATAVKRFCFSTPLVIDVAGKQQIISAGPGLVAAYDPHDGREIWKVRYEGYSVVPCPAYGHGLLFVSSGYDSPTLFAVRVEGAAGDVTESHVAWRLKKGAPHNPSPLVVGNDLYLISDLGVATCLDARTGDQHWQQRIGGAFSASPLYADGKIYLQSEDGEGIVIKVAPQFEEISRNKLGERTLASYGVGDGALFIRTERHLLRIQDKPAGK